MKKIFFLTLLGSVFIQRVPAATVYWDGGGNDGLWATSLNWSSDIIPQVGDDVILDNSIVSTNYTVTLPGVSIPVSIASITITPSANNFITVILPTTNTANPGLALTGPGNSLLLNDRAVFKNSSGASAGSGIAVSSTFRINNGGRYIHNTSRGNASIVSQLSTAAGTESGIFEFNVPQASYVLSLSGRTFGTLVLSSQANNGTVTYSGSGASVLNINGNLEINSGVNLAISMSAAIILRGNYLQASGSTFNLQSSVNNNTVQVKGNFTSQGVITETNTGLPVLEFNGTTTQSIDATGAAFQNTVDVRINNTAGVALVSDLTLPYRLSLLSGNVTIGDHDLATGAINQINLPSLNNNHIITNGTGSLKLTGVINNVFPVGPSAVSYNPVTVSGGNGMDFYVRVEAGINPSVAFPAFGINRTWNIKSSAIVAGVGLSFQYSSADANVNAPQPQDMEILRYSNSAWNVIPGNNNISPTGADPSWQLTTIVPIPLSTASTAFALGVDGGYILPLCTNCTLIPGLITVHKKLELKLEPNPARDLLNIEIQSPSRQNISLSIFDLSGVTRKTFSLIAGKGKNTYTLSISNFSNGIYFLKAESDFQVLTLKFLKH